MAHPERPYLHLVHTPPPAESRVEHKLQRTGNHLLAATNEHMSQIEPDERRNFNAKDSIFNLAGGTEIYAITNEPFRNHAPPQSAGFYIHNGWGTRRLTIHVERSHLHIEEVKVPEDAEWNACMDKLMDLDWEQGIHQTAQLPVNIQLLLPPVSNEKQTYRTVRWTARHLDTRESFKDRMLRALGLDA